tara:strand:- start:504 stop:836 length:333 start_codon:yes stop_codon:yes gene_type:complete
MKLTGTEFKNSDTCEGVSYSHESARHDIAIITIDGRYPEEGWAMNETSEEMAVVMNGSGKLMIKDDAVVRLEKGDGAYVPAGEWFAWSGNMTLAMSCSPPFSEEQYSWKE